MTDAASAILRANAITKRFGAVTAVDGVSLDVHTNEFLCLLGPSGCGKTTLLRLMAGLETPDAGQIFIDGRDVTATPPYGRPANMMFQSYALFPHMTVAANVAFGLKQEGLSGEGLASRVHDALATVELSDLGERMPRQLSGGQKQRVALARCIAKRPKVLLLDEPMAALDKHLRERTQLELMALRRRLGISFVVVTHDQDEAMTMADRVAVMDAGRILQVAPPRQLYERPSSRATAAFFGDVNLWEGQVTEARALHCPALQRELTSGDVLPAPGSVVAIAVRPEQIQLSRHVATGEPNQLAGEVSDVIYRGTTTTYFVRLVNAAIIRIVRQNAGADAVFSKGEAVHMSWPPAATRVLPP